MNRNSEKCENHQGHPHKQNRGTKREEKGKKVKNIFGHIMAEVLNFYKNNPSEQQRSYMNIKELYT